MRRSIQMVIPRQKLEMLACINIESETNSLRCLSSQELIPRLLPTFYLCLTSSNIIPDRMIKVGVITTTEFHFAIIAVQPRVQSVLELQVG